MPQRQNALLSIETNPQSAQPLSLGLSVPDRVVRGQPLNGRLVASGGTGGYVFGGLVSGALPPGTGPIDGVTGAIPGTPTAVGRYTFSAQVQDSSGTVTPPTSFVIEVVSTLTPRDVTPRIGEVAQGYSYKFRVFGATGTVTWTKLSGAFPAGLALSGGDTLAGTPFAPAGTSYARMRATDSGSGDTLDVSIAVTIVPALVANDIPQAYAAVGVMTIIPFDISGGMPPYYLSLQDGNAWPSGLTVVRQRPSGRLVLAGQADPLMGLLNPNLIRYFTVNANVTDALGVVDPFTVVITVGPAQSTLGALKNGIAVVGRGGLSLNFLGQFVKDVSVTTDQVQVTIDRDGSPLSLLGRAGITSGVVGDIVAGSDNTVLTRMSGALAFTAVYPAMLLQSGFDSPSDQNFYRGDGRFLSTVNGPWTALSYKVGANQVVGARDTGWAAATGTADKTTYATYAAATIGAAYNATVQGQLQTALNHVQLLSRQVKALKDALIAHGLIGP